MVLAFSAKELCITRQALKERSIAISAILAEPSESPPSASASTSSSSLPSLSSNSRSGNTSSAAASTSVVSRSIPLKARKTFAAIKN